MIKPGEDKGRSVRDQVAEALVAEPSGEGRRRKVRDIRARAAVEQFRGHAGRDEEGVLTVRSRSGGVVRLGRVEYGELDGVSHVDVYTSGDTAGGDPHFRIINPPTLVEDPHGDIELGGNEIRGKDGVTLSGARKRYREDPVRALAEVIARHGGSERMGSKR